MNAPAFEIESPDEAPEEFVETLAALILDAAACEIESENADSLDRRDAA